ncbi:MAG: response regulator transcription factor [Dehalococcoides mccartyi]|nr:response regulator transcription factor [Dehalococcoides mccartyi]AII59688.1 transcriptional regulator [Dehalococcoides mccartyi CG4]AQU03391.1 transcriptional regulator [Dehalococcoides mccartyi]AQU04689.1 transcriptional regulator [Dehalococcoides mccartyi]MBF4482257.1 response regulator transcription factor [Dehalococcoides mccartyi]MBJ7531831.1 response regulator transcription factor [Dehalococcoides mccartyi]
MLKLFIVTADTKKMGTLLRELEADRFEIKQAASFVLAYPLLAEFVPDIVLLDFLSLKTEESEWEIPENVSLAKNPLIMGLLPADDYEEIALKPGLDDFIRWPGSVNELKVRLVRLAEKWGMSEPGIIRAGDLIIDTLGCEVTLSGRLLDLTFREFELLKFLAQNRGRVFSREALLNKVWGYDYYGGDRTVDVHITRLRGKIEDQTHTFVETVRNIGYRFKRRF